MKTSDLVVKAALFGAGGWAIENTLSETPKRYSETPKRYSALFQGRHVPWLPVYAFGGAIVMLLAPRLRESHLSWYARAGIYAVTLSAVEYAGCLIDRKTLGACSWDYASSGKKCSGDQGCVDFKHAALWGMLGLAVEKVAKQ
jgi:uncharacterized membrane protein